MIFAFQFKLEVGKTYAHLWLHPLNSEERRTTPFMVLRESSREEWERVSLADGLFSHEMIVETKRVHIGLGYDYYYLLLVD